MSLLSTITLRDLKQPSLEARIRPNGLSFTRPGSVLTSAKKTVYTHLGRSKKKKKNSARVCGYL